MLWALHSEEDARLQLKDFDLGRAIVAIVFLATLALIVLVLLFAGHSDTRNTASIGGQFNLIDDEGKTVSEASLLGKPSVVYFGYTYCPDVCPTTLQDIARWMKLLGPAADQMNFVFVTVDPQRDTPRLLHVYLASFDRRIRGLTGKIDEIARIAKEYGVYFKRVSGPSGTYSEDHSTRIYLMGENGQFVDTIGYQEPDASAMQKIRKLIALDGR